MSGVGKRLTLNFGRNRQKKAKSPEPRDELDYELSGYRKGIAGGMSSTLGVPAVKGTKSGSLGSLTSDSLDPALSKDDIMSLTHDVGTFSKALAKLKCVFVDASNNKSDYDVGVAAHDKLGEVLCILKNVLQKYPALHTTDVLTAAAVLITKIKSSQYEDSGGAAGDLHSSIDQLALAFSSSVSEYLMGDIDNFPSIGKTKSYDNLASAEQDQDDSIERDSACMGPGELVKLDQGIDIALQRAKIFSKYTKDIIYYMEKRAALECEYAKNLAKLASTVRHTITEESFLPFQSTYCTSCDQDMEYMTTCQNKASLLQTEEFIEPLNTMRIEFDKLRKQFKEAWTRELRKMHDSDSNVRKAKSMYIARQQEYEKAKEMYQKAEAETGNQNAGAKAEKKKKLEEEASIKAKDSETTYKACIAEANKQQQELDQVKADILAKIGELIHAGDLTLKTATVNYFQLQHRVTSTPPLQNQALSESSMLYEPGSQYHEYIRHLPIPPTVTSHSDSFVFEPYGSESQLSHRKPSTQSSGSASSDAHLFGEESPSQSPEKSNRKPWHDKIVAGSDTDSISEASSRSRESSPSASPYTDKRRLVNSSSMNELAEADRDAQFDHRLAGVSVSAETNLTFRGVVLSRAAKTHVLKKLRTPSRCRECESYVYFQGAECEKCGLSSHKRCLETLHWECGHKPQDRRMTTFGVDLNAHIQKTQTDVPHVIRKCIKEIDCRGLHLKGIYRMSGVKSRVEKLCQSFETDEHRVDLSEHHPNIIANVLKLYLRQLPEPLLTFRLYHDLINLAKEEQATDRADESGTLEKLKSIILTLPKPNMQTCNRLMYHLKRVTDESYVNQMTAINLGIVFGPTLLRPSEGAASLHSLMDTPHQSRIIELLISKVQYIFGPEERDEEDEKELRDAHRVSSVQILSPGTLDSAVEDDITPAGTQTKKATSDLEDSSTGETRCFITNDPESYFNGFVPEITENLLDELAKEEPRFQQVADDSVHNDAGLDGAHQEILPSGVSTGSDEHDKLADSHLVPDASEENVFDETDDMTVSELVNSLLPDYFKTAIPSHVRVSRQASCPHMSSHLMHSLPASLSIPLSPSQSNDSNSTTTGTPSGRLVSVGHPANSPGLRRKLLARDLRRSSLDEEDISKIHTVKLGGMLTKPRQFSPVPLRRKSTRNEGTHARTEARSTFYTVAPCDTTSSDSGSSSLGEEKHPKLKKKMSAPEQTEPTYV